MTSIDPSLLLFVAYRKHQRAEVLSRPAWLGATDDHYLLFMHGLEFQPLARSLARVVEPRCALGDYTLFVVSLRPGELAPTKLSDVLAVAQQRIAPQNGFQNLLALKQRLSADVVATCEKCVKNDI